MTNMSTKDFYGLYKGRRVLSVSFKGHDNRDTFSKDLESRPAIVVGYSSSSVLISFDDVDGGWLGGSNSGILFIPSDIDRAKFMSRRSFWFVHVGSLKVIDDGPTSKTGVDRFPHKCPACGSPAYVGFTAVECSRCA